MVKRETTLVQNNLESDRAIRDKFSGSHKIKWVEKAILTPSKYGKNPKRSSRAFDKIRLGGTYARKRNEESTIVEDTNVDERSTDKDESPI